METVLVTGGQGYVGSLLVPELLKVGYKVKVIDLGIFRYKCDYHPNLIQFKGDIRDIDDLNYISKDVDHIIHLASISNDPSFDLNPKLGKSINFDSTKNIVKICNEKYIDRLIVASSTSQYGIKPLSMKVTEDTPAEPITDYAKYKIMSEELIRDTIESTSYMFARPYTLCGYSPRMRFDLAVNAMTISAIMNSEIHVYGGTQIRPTLNVNDMIRFYVKSLKYPESLINKQAFNITYKNMSLNEIAEEIKGTFTYDIEIIHHDTDDIRSYHVNADKIKNTLKFKCHYGIKDGIDSIKHAYFSGLFHHPFNNPLYYNIKRMEELKLE
jgi:nucleoside-diphosphate-sugar epimerase